MKTETQDAADKRTQCPSCGQIVPLQSELAAGKKWTPEWLANYGKADNWLESICEAHNSALAAEREISAELAEQVHTGKQALELATERSLQVVELKQQLAAEREKCKPLVEALKANMEWIGKPPTGKYDYDSQREDAWAKGKAALAKAEKK